MALVRLPSSDRFWAKVDRSGECWVWNGARDKRGYGRVGIKEQGISKTFLAHRVAFLYENVVPEGFELDHLCRNPSCVRPAHLEVVTHTENVGRGFAGVLNNHMTRRTECVNGHPLSGDNLYRRRGSGVRECKECRRENVRRWRAAQ